MKTFAEVEGVVVPGRCICPVEEGDDGAASRKCVGARSLAADFG